jgi:hypothetical protein
MCFAGQILRKENERQAAEEKIMARPVLNQHAAGIDVGDHSHWIC